MPALHAVEILSTATPPLPYRFFVEFVRMVDRWKQLFLPAQQGTDKLGSSFVDFPPGGVGRGYEGCSERGTF